MKRHLFTSESVTEGHPDKIADQISDAVLDAIYDKDPNGRVACETLVTTGLAFVAGEITTSCYIEIPQIVRETIHRIGYVEPELGFASKTCGVTTSIQAQSPDIALGVDKGGAGDQGMMFGYATNETPEFMPLPLVMAHRLARRLSDVRKQRLVDYLRPDGKTQVTVEYHDGHVARLEAVVVSAHHKPGVPISRIRSDIRGLVIEPVVPKHWLDRKTKVFVNPTGRFEVGGPMGDTGLTGRKIIMDTYGGVIGHGGGCFCITGDARVSTGQGLVPLQDLQAPVDAGLLVKTDTHPHPAGQWFDNGLMETVRLRTKGGYAVEGTPNQRIRVIDRNGRYRWRRLDAIVSSDRIAIHRQDRPFGDGTLAPFVFAHKPGTAEGRINRFSFPKILTEDYAYLLGLLVGDGNCMMEGGIAICVCEPQQHRNVQAVYQRLFGRPGTIFGHWAYVAGVELRAYLRHLGLGYCRSWQKRVPGTVFQAPRPVVAAFLRGLFDTDGSVTIQGRTRTSPLIQLASSSLTLIQEVQQLLLNFGIISSMATINNLQRTFQIRQRAFRPARLVYELRLKGAQGIRRFAQEIGFGLSRKQQVLSSVRLEPKRNLLTIPYQRGRIRGLWRLLPVEERRADRCRVGRFLRATRGKATKELTYEKLHEFLTTYEPSLGTHRAFQWLKQLYAMGHHYDQLDSVEKTGVKHVYDVFVPGAHTFIANGFVCHNSGKDPTKVDRSAAYMARYVAKHLVAAGLADRCEIELAYAIGIAEPVSVMVDTHGTGKLSEQSLVKLIREVFDLTPNGIIRTLKLRRPIYLKTAAYGHFGRQDEGFTWEELDRLSEVKRAARHH